MSSTKKSSLEKEKERLEALQNREKKFLTGMYGDFFGGRVDELEKKGRELEQSGVTAETLRSMYSADADCDYAE